MYNDQTTNLLSTTPCLLVDHWIAMPASAASLVLNAIVQRLSGNSTLWIVDENADYQVGVKMDGMDLTLFISNRYDVQQQLKHLGYRCELTDFALPEQKFDQIVFRVAKEKPAVHHLLNQCFSRLNPAGKLILLGKKSEGIKTYAKKAGVLLDGEARSNKVTKEILIYEIAKGVVAGEALDDKNYAQLRAIGELQHQTVHSKPGVFAWNKFDKGSLILAKQLQLSLSEKPARALPKVLDLACGYGYLSLVCHHQIACHITAVDNNIAAITACRENFAQHQVLGDCKLSDACQQLPTNHFDLVVCNPPFHAGFSHQKSTTEYFCQQIAKVLHKTGSAYVVVNSFLPIAKIADKYFQHCQRLNQENGFDVYLLQQPQHHATQTKNYKDKNSAIN